MTFDHLLPTNNIPFFKAAESWLWHVFTYFKTSDGIKKDFCLKYELKSKKDLIFEGKGKEYKGRGTVKMEESLIIEN